MAGVWARHHTRVSEEGTLAVLHRPARHATLPEGFEISVELSVTVTPAYRPTEVRHHFRVSVERRESCPVMLSPRPEVKASGSQHGRALLGAKLALPPTAFLASFVGKGVTGQEVISWAPKAASRVAFASSVVTLYRA